MANSVSPIHDDNCTAVLSQLGASRDAAGGTTEVWTTVATLTGIASEFGEQPADVGGQVRRVVTGSLSVAPAAGDVASANMRLVFGSGAPAGLAGLTAEVTSVARHAADAFDLVNARTKLRFREVVA